MVPIPSGRMPALPIMTPIMYKSRTGPILPKKVTLLQSQRTPAGAVQNTRQRMMQLKMFILLGFSIANLQNLFNFVNLLKQQLI